MMLMIVSLLLLLALGVDCSVNIYDHENLSNNFLIYRKNAMYDVGSAPFVRKDGRGVISMDLQFSFAEDVVKEDNGFVQVSVFPMEDYQYIGVVNGKNASDRIFCCTAKMASRGDVCSRQGSLIINKQATNVETWDVFPESPSLLTKSYNIPKKGFYFLVISYCDDNAVSVDIDGATRWENPYGYLPGEVYGFLGFYSNMSLAYIFTALIWAYLCGRHWRDLLMLQNFLTLVIGFGLIEVQLRYHDFYHFNQMGSRSKGLLLSSIFFLCLKKTVSRLLVLVVSMGWGVVKPTLGDVYGKIIMLGGAYFCFSCIQLVVESLSHNRSLTFSGYLLVLPVICLDFAFFLWIFSSLSTITANLEERRQETKLQLYTRFRMVLIMCVTVGVLWSIFFSYATMSAWGETHWEEWYLLESFWDILYFVILVCILVLWAPTSNSNRYAYDKVQTWDHDDEEYGDDLEDVVAVEGSKSIQMS